VQAGAEDVVLVVDPGVELIVRAANAAERERGSLHAWLYARSNEQHQPAGSAFSETDGTGARLVFPGLQADERYTVWIEPSGTEWYGLATDVRAGQGDVTVRLERGATIRGRVAAHAGATHVGVQASNEQGLLASAQVDAQGLYEDKGLPPGRWTIRAHGRVGDRRFAADGTVSTGGTLDLTLEERVR
jgi:hypothetical protein